MNVPQITVVVYLLCVWWRTVLLSLCMTQRGEVSELLRTMTSAIAVTLKSTLESMHSSLKHMVDFATASVEDIKLAVAAAVDPVYQNDLMRAVLTQPAACKITPLHKLIEQFSIEYHKVCALDDAQVLPDPYKVVLFNLCLTDSLDV